jgi:predicted SnoaL-like aldol condensation-catalyzing enzyme
MRKAGKLIFIPVIFFILFSCKTAADKKVQQYSVSQDEKSEENNKKMVMDFYQALFGDKNLDAIDQYIGDVYIQHNPGAQDGKEALKKFLEPYFSNAPREKVDFRHVAADGDLVFLHIRSVRGDQVSAIVDIFRIENGKIVEHWDVIQQVPDNSVNPHPMF